MKRVMIAMSGGVDSSASAYLLQKEGYDVAGVTMHFSVRFPDGSSVPIGASAVSDAAAVCSKLSIPHHVVDMNVDFNEFVVTPFVGDYFAARTPNPCVVCNKMIKFGRLSDFAESAGYSYFSTGHYADIVRIDEKYFLKRNRDERKDQTYFLYVIKKEKLPTVIFPLAAMTKDDTREIARHIGLHVADKGDSQDICFLQGSDYRDFLERWITISGEQFPPGDFVDEAGRVLGRHEGLYRYTIGQRRGLGIAHECPLYVSGFDVASNRVIVGPRESLRALSCEAGDLNLFDDISGEGLTVRTRYAQRGVPCFAKVEGEKLHIEFPQGIDAVTPGQSAVIYRDDLLLGGGVILSTKKG